MFQGLFITGTDTNVGKTAVAAAVMHRYRGFARLRYWKPVQTGIEQDDDTAEVRRLGGCPEHEIFSGGVRLPKPLSPHLAAKMCGRTVAVDELLRLTAGQSEAMRWVVEGAGGALVPLNDTELMTDLMRGLGLPALVVARSALGTINHTLLTLEALRSRSLRVAGVVLVGEKNLDNREAIEQFGAVSVLGEMPRFDQITRADLAAWAMAELDPHNGLREYFE